MNLRRETGFLFVILLLVLLALTACQKAEGDPTPTPDRESAQAASTLFAQPTRQSGPTPTVTPVNEVELELSRMVADMERAVLAGDGDAYLSHVWEGAAALHAPFVDACLLRGLKKLASGQSARALRDFQTANTYPENLQAGRPGDAGQGPKIHYYTSRAYRALGDAPHAETELRKAFEGRVADGEMNYYRLLACRTG